MRIKETSVSEPLMTCRKHLDDVKTEALLAASRQTQRKPVY